MKTEIVKAKKEHCAALARAMEDPKYPWNGDFVRRYWNVEPEQGLLDSLNISPLCWTILVDGEVAGMFGCTDQGQVWLTTAPAMEKVKLRFIRQSGPYIERMKKTVGSVFGYAHIDNKALSKWLEWCGFEKVGRTGEFGIWVCR